MRRCAFLSTSGLEDFFVYDDLVKPHLRELGWHIEDLNWHDSSNNYNKFDLVIVRSTWDYQQSPSAFLQCLERIEASSARLENPFELMRWNIDKRYLKELEQKGVATLPTIWLDEYEQSAIEQSFDDFECEEIIVKPQLSANADFTYRLTHASFQQQSSQLEGQLVGKPLMLQAFEKSIIEEGEYSLFYFNSEFSHAINKLPAKRDFRVQEEHGGTLLSVKPSAEMLALSEQTLAALPNRALYARVDILQTSRGLAIIEVELIEPSLYFNMDEGSAKRFAEAINSLY